MNKEQLKQIIINLIKSNSTPHGIALGVAIGVFIAVMPVYGLHTVLVLIAAFLVRPANKVALLLGTNISLPPTVPFITWGSYEIGKFILNKNYPALTRAYFSSFNLQSAKDLYYPLFVGSAIFGLVCAVFFYFITFFFVRQWEKRHGHVR